MFVLIEEVDKEIYIEMLLHPEDLAKLREGIMVQRDQHFQGKPVYVGIFANVGADYLFPEEVFWYEREAQA